MVTSEAGLATTWAYRAQRERESALRFRRIERRLRHIDAPQVFVAAAAQAARDEDAHAAQCIGLARTLGSSKTIADPGVLAEVGPDALTLEQRVLYEIVAFACLGETLNVALLSEELRALDDKRTRTTTRHILRDEVQHARFGWAYLRHMAERGAATPLVPYIVMMIDVAAQHEIFEDGHRHRPELGGLSLKRRHAVVADTLQHVVLPGLSGLGLDTTAATQSVMRFAKL